MRSLIFFIILYNISAANLFAEPSKVFTKIPTQHPSSLGFVYEAKVGTEIIKVPFAIFLPKCYEEDKSRKFPVILFLHGAGEGGTDLNGIFIHGPCGVTSRNPAMVANLPFILVSPQSTRGWDATMIKAVTSLLKVLPEHYRLDKDRVVVTGLSMGGIGSWAALADAPELYAGAVPMCARQWPDPDALALAIQNKSLWLIVGGVDADAFLGGQIKMNAALVEVGADTQIKIVPNMGHGVWEIYYNNPEFYHWIARQFRASDAMLLQANGFRKLQSPDNALCFSNIETLKPDRSDSSGLIAGWDAQWYKDTEFKTALIRRNEPKIEYGTGEFGLPGEIKENISLRASAWVKIEKAGLYSFTTAADDGTRLFVGNQKIIDDWNGHGVVEQTGKLKLQAGYYKIVLEYFQGGGGAAISLFWSSGEITRKILGSPEIFSEAIPK
jgi:pimeloyl-ACP methyl ester carboxylesterase